MILGTAAAYAGQILRQYDIVFTFTIAAISFITGMIAVVPRRSRTVRPPQWGVAGAFAYGAVYSIAAVTTSAGPLMLLLTLSAAVGKPGWGALLSLAYAIGRGAPFLLVGWFAGAASRAIFRIRRSQRPIEIASAIILFAVAIWFAWSGLVMMRASG